MSLANFVQNETASDNFASLCRYLILAELQLQIDLVDHSLENLQRIAREVRFWLTAAACCLARPTNPFPSCIHRFGDAHHLCLALQLEQRKRNAVDMHSGGDRQYFELYQRLKEEPGGTSTRHHARIFVWWCTLVVSIHGRGRVTPVCWWWFWH